MAYIKFHRGSQQIGGCCTELCCGDEKILIDLGANLPGTDDECPISDEQLIRSVFDGKSEYGAILFTHYHGDHYGLYKDIPRNIPIYSDIPMYMGETAKEILSVVTVYIDINAGKKGGKLVKGIKTYAPGRVLKIRGIDDIKITPLVVDHSALDAYMFYIEMAGKKILYTGDFRDHGIASEHDRFWRMIGSHKYVPADIDLLITEGTMLSREKEIKENTVRTEAELGEEAAKRFKEQPYNYVLVSSTNLDSIIELYYNTPDDLPFVCDYYQYKIICKAMQGKKDWLKMYRPRKLKDGATKPIHVLIDGYKQGLQKTFAENDEHDLFLPVVPVTFKNGYESIKDGFVMLIRPNHYPENGKNTFEKALDHFSAIDEDKVKIMYSMWGGYLKGDKEDKAITGLIGHHNNRSLHVSGHAYPETILKLIEETNPKIVVPMHTQMAYQMKEMELFSDYSDRIIPMKDMEQVLDLDKMKLR